MAIPNTPLNQTITAASSGTGTSAIVNSNNETFVLNWDKPIDATNLLSYKIYYSTGAGWTLITTLPYTDQAKYTKALKLSDIGLTLTNTQVVGFQITAVNNLGEESVKAPEYNDNNTLTFQAVQITIVPANIINTGSGTVSIPWVANTTITQISYNYNPGYPTGNPIEQGVVYDNVTGTNNGTATIPYAGDTVAITFKSINNEFNTVQLTLPPKIGEGTSQAVTEHVTYTLSNPNGSIVTATWYADKKITAIAYKYGAGDSSVIYTNSYGAFNGLVTFPFNTAALNLVFTFDDATTQSINTTIPDSPAVPAIGAGIVRVTDTQVTIQWSAQTPIVQVDYTPSEYIDWKNAYSDLANIGKLSGNFTIDGLSQDTSYSYRIRMRAPQGSSISIPEAADPVVTFKTSKTNTLAGDIEVKVISSDTVLVTWQSSDVLNYLYYSIDDSVQMSVNRSMSSTSGSFYITGLDGDCTLSVKMIGIYSDLTTGAPQSVLLTQFLNLSDRTQVGEPVAIPDIDVDNIVFPYVYYNPLEKPHHKITALEWNTIFTLLLQQGNYTSKALNLLNLAQIVKDVYAKNVIATAIDPADTSEANVQAKLDLLMDQIQGVALGAIPIGSVVEPMLNAEYARSLAKKNTRVQIGLNADLLNGKRITDLDTTAVGEIRTFTSAQNLGEDYLPCIGLSILPNMYPELEGKLDEYYTFETEDVTSSYGTRLSYLEGMWYLYGTGNAIYKSEDRINWQLQTTLLPTTTVNAIDYYNGLFVIATSSEGIFVGGTVNDAVRAAGTDVIGHNDIAQVPGRVYVVGNTGNVWSSTDGISYTKLTNANTAHMKRIKAHPSGLNYCYAVGESGAFYKITGTTVTVISTGTSVTLNDLMIMPDETAARITIVGNSGYCGQGILTSTGNIFTVVGNTTVSSLALGSNFTSATMFLVGGKKYGLLTTNTTGLNIITEDAIKFTLDDKIPATLAVVSYTGVNAGVLYAKAGAKLLFSNTTSKVLPTLPGYNYIRVQVGTANLTDIEYIAEMGFAPFASTTIYVGADVPDVPETTHIKTGYTLAGYSVTAVLVSDTVTELKYTGVWTENTMGNQMVVYIDTDDSTVLQATVLQPNGIRPNEPTRPTDGTKWFIGWVVDETRTVYDGVPAVYFKPSFIEI